jgi:ethanolamine utilization protein EutQ (cupin superfamily)
MSEVTVFPLTERRFEYYLGNASSPGGGVARIARLVGASLSSSIGAGVVVYERLTIDWTFAFDEVVIVLEGAMSVRSGDKVYECRAGDVAWFPANQALTYEVADRVVVFYATYPVASTLQDRGTSANIKSSSTPQ